jgi:hypothetical protein
MFSLISRTALRSATSGTACRSAAAPVLLRQYGATTTQQSVTINKNNTNFNVNSTNNVNASANASTAANNAKPPSSFAFVDGVDYQLIVGVGFSFLRLSSFFAHLSHRPRRVLSTSRLSIVTFFFLPFL